MVETLIRTVTKSKKLIRLKTSIRTKNSRKKLTVKKLKSSKKKKCPLKFLWMKMPI